MNTQEADTYKECAEDWQVVAAHARRLEGNYRQAGDTDLADQYAEFADTITRLQNVAMFNRACWDGEIRLTQRAVDRALTAEAKLAEAEKELTRLRAITQGPPVQRTKDKRKAL